MLKFIFFILQAFLLCCCITVKAQQVQWASQVVFHHGGFASDADFSAQQLVGKPDAMPLGSLHPKAFRLQKEQFTGIIRVAFNKPEPIQQVVIIESFQPGSITKILLYDDYGKKFIVYDKPAQEAAEKFRAFTLIFPQTTYKVSKVEISMSTSGKPRWSQIDAIGIINSQEPYKLTGFTSGKVLEKPETIKTFVSEKINLGGKINSKFTEMSPIISPDGKFLYFARQNHPDNSGKRNDPQDIWFSTLQSDGSWSQAQNIGEPLNDNNPNGVCSVSPDGNTLLLLNQYNSDGSISPGVSVSRKKKGGGWTFPEAQQIKDDHNRSDYANYFMVNDGKTMVMAVDRKDSYGDQDLYVSFLEGSNSWSKPLNLGNIINTPKAEFSPFMASDGKTLYFASEGHTGFGESDIYYSKRLDDSWTKWSKPETMGNQINTPSWDGYYTVSAAGDYAYLVSKEKAIDNSRDIFKIALPNALKPEPVILVYGKVYNAKTKEPIDARIVFEKLPSGREAGVARSHPEDGSYKIILPNGSNYGYLAEAKGFIGITENLDVSDIKKYQEIKQDLYLVPIEVGQVITLTNVFFLRSKAELLDNSYPELDRLVNFMLGNPSVEIELAGHTDNNGGHDANMRLSEGRVLAVQNYLISKGIKSKRLSWKAYGPTRPIASNDTEETRRLNRRVEFIITKH